MRSASHSAFAVVDDGGHLLAFSRMDGGRISSVYVAINKAVSAATRRSPTGPIPNAEEASVILSIGLPLASGGLVTPIGGGLPVMLNGECVGGIGVSGGSEQQDVECAEAGLLALRP